MKVALITGVNGQDGAYLAKFLLEKNYTIIGTVRVSPKPNLKNLEYLGIRNLISIEKIDLLDKSSISSILHRYKPDEIYNLAAQSSVGISFKHPIETFSFNTGSVNNLLEVIRTEKANIKFYQASSSEMFGNVKNLPVTLTTQMKPTSPYAISKVASHFMSSTYRDAYNLFICAGILFNHESILRNNNFFIKKVIIEAIRIQKGLQNILLIGNLNVKRDFGYAPKYVEAMWLMMQQDKPQDFMICSGKSILLQDIVYYIFDRLSISKERISIDKKLYRPSEVKEIYGDNLNAKKLLGWNYNYSFFEILNVLIEEILEKELYLQL